MLSIFWMRETPAPDVYKRQPYTLSFTFRGQVRPEIKALPGIAAIDDKTYELKGGDLHKMWELVNDACCNWLDV